MGKEKYQKKILELFEKSPVVNFKSIERIVKEKNSKSEYAKQLVNQLIKQNKIKKITKGLYTKHNESSLLVFAFKPSYLGLQDALSFYGLWEQETIPVIVTTKKVRTGIRNVMDSNILIRRIDKRYMFGSDHFDQGGFAIPYSDMEKTFIDMIYFKQHMDENVLQELKKKIKVKKLKEYLDKYPKTFRNKVLKIWHGT